MMLTRLAAHSLTLILCLKRRFTTLIIGAALVLSAQAAEAKLDQKRLAAVTNIINMLLLDTEAFTLKLGEIKPQAVIVSKSFKTSFPVADQDVEVCFIVSSSGSFRSGNLKLSINGRALTGSSQPVIGENCYTVPRNQQRETNTLEFDVPAGVSVVLRDIGVEPAKQSRLRLNSLTRSSWNEKAVRKVLRIFAFGGHATDGQILRWADMNPNKAIAEMLNFDKHNPKLSPISSQERYPQTATQYGEFEDFVRNFLSNPASDLPISVKAREKYATRGYAFDDAFSYMVTTRGLNPFRQMVGFWETNYHLAVNLDTDVNNDDMMKFYDTIMNAHESRVPYQRVLAAAAKATAPIAQYGHNNNEWINDTCFCNQDFAREIHQLYFGIFGEGDEDHHENITIPNTASMLTGMKIHDRVPDPKRPGRFKYQRRYDPRVEFDKHHVPALNILRKTVAGAGPLQKIDALVEHSIQHPESLRNLPLMIIEGIADDNLNEARKQQLRAAWAAMGANKQFLTFIRAYAISDLFHSPEQLKYMNSFWKAYYLSNKFNLENVESLQAMRDGRLGRPINNIIDGDDVQEFRPTHNVFGGQTGLEAANSASVFEENYNRATDDDYRWHIAAECDDCDQGRSWTKDWGAVIPKRNGQHRVDDVARWLWKHTTGDLDQYTQLERAHLVSILGATLGEKQDRHFDLTMFLCIYNDRREQNQTPNNVSELTRRANRHCRHDSGSFSANETRWLNKAYSLEELTNRIPGGYRGPYNPAIQDGVIPSILNQLGNINMPLLSDDENLRKQANRRIHYAMAFISGTPFMFLEAGE